MKADPSDVDSYARAAARMSGLSIDETWWPSVSGHLATLLEHAADLDGFEKAENPAPVFAP